MLKTGCFRTSYQSIKLLFLQETRIGARAIVCRSFSLTFSIIFLDYQFKTLAMVRGVKNVTLGDLAKPKSLKF